MTKYWRTAAFALLVGALAAPGCGPPGRTKEETIEVKENSGLEQAKQVLNNYAKGQALGSEVTSFDNIVSRVRETDAARADVLQKGFADLQKPKADTKAKAKEILKALEPKMTGGS
ncbi:hypothetical protein R5W24_002075 [Gemmata sp. JC717]|uniref:Lipoprotein n=1 Tax=Gemmata algarum TaxID=2975278 RepID=A0ABU5EVE5_9BACT|nr:hypothetical protein [Gemmata algarum]MDY3552985.1 hypothetical protein [Gemmata algarum]MDY3559130.1 hypothetical protein [Gemmata algarum]